MSNSAPYPLPLHFLVAHKKVFMVKYIYNKSEVYNMSKKKAAFLILTISYFLLTVCDLLLTFIATPDLELEGNPLVRGFGMDWFGLIAVNILTYTLYFVMAYYSYIKYKSPKSAETQDVRRYLSDITYGDPEKVNIGMWRLPKYWSPQVACLCFAVSTAMPIARLVIVFEWYFILKGIEASLFFSIVAVFPMGRIDFFIALFLAWGLTFVWIYSEFHANRDAVLKEKE